MSEPFVSSRFPYLLVQVRFGQQALTVEALIDTGFDGDVLIPRAIVPPGVEPEREARWRLADDSPIVTPLYVAEVSIDAFGPVPVLVAALGNETLVGRALIAQFRVILEHGERVIVEP